MVADEPSLNNWKRKSGLLWWGMDIPDEQGQGPATMTRRCTLDAVRLLGNFATVGRAYWTTESDGQGAVVQDFSESSEPPFEQLARIDLPDLYETILRLDLLVTYPTPPIERVLPNDGLIFCEYEQWLSNNEEHTRGPGVHLRVSLRVDIYARRTDTYAKENTVLADLNAPRLNRYLRVLQEHFGQRFTNIEYEGDASQIDHNGFVGHDESPA